jgi:hypothetical protein
VDPKDKITAPIIDHVGRATVMLDSLASQWGVEQHEIRPRHVEYVVGHFAEVEAVSRKHERMLLQTQIDGLREKLNELLAALHQKGVIEGGGA